MAAVLFAATFLLLPGDSYALVTYGAQVTHQVTTSKAGSTGTKSSQDRFSFFFNLNTSPTPKLSLSGDMKFDVLMNKRGSTSESTELQPNITLRAAMPALQVSTGYRAVLRDESTTSGTKTSELSSRSKDMFIDNSLRAGKLPTLRLRYAIRDQNQTKDGVLTQSSKSSDMTASLTYRLGILSLTADYKTQSSTNKMTGDTRDSSQANIQTSMATAIGTKASLNMRDSYNYSDSGSNGTISSKNYTNTGEARISLKPLNGMAVTSNYVLRHAGNILTHQMTSRERTWFTNATYSFPKYLKVYGSYNNRQNESGSRTTISEATIAGANFAHKVGNFALTSRYEKRFDSNTNESGTTTTKTSTTRDNFDWLMTWNAAKYLKADLSESLVTDHSNNKTNKNTRYRLKTSVGPIKNLTASPYIDYSISAPAGAIKTYNTDIVVPVQFRLDLHKKIALSATDNYRWHTTENGSNVSRSQTNNLTVRLDFSRPLPGTTLSADASFSTNISESAVTNTSSYTLRANYAYDKHSLSTNMRFQTGDNIPDSAGLTMQYGLNLMLKKAALNLQARYNYNVTYAARVSSTQDIYLLLKVKK